MYVDMAYCYRVAWFVGLSQLWAL